MTPLARMRSLLGVLLTTVGVAVAALLCVPVLLGYERYVVTGTSMTGAIDRGSLVFGELVPVPDLRVGDVITFKPPRPMGPSELVTHRIVWRGADAQGRIGFRTKGDANPSEDPHPFVLSAPRQARVAFHVPYLGYGLAFAAERRHRMLLIGLPALLLAVSVLTRLWRETAPTAVAPAPA